MFKVECFLDNTDSEGVGPPCIGAILHYYNDRRESLGECRVGVSKSVHINAPTMLYLKPGPSEGSHSRAWFTPSGDEAPELRSLGWKGIQMRGFITWWFSAKVIEIVHSSDTIANE